MGLCMRCLFSSVASRKKTEAPPEDSSSPKTKTGGRIGPYKLLEQIGEGGMGLVWRAEQEEPVRRRVALKVIKQGLDSRQVLARFEAERQALAMMEHPNIAKVLDANSTPDGRPYFVMELVEGISITEFCDEQRLSVRERLALFIPVCHAIQHAHQKGIIHRDVKPSNVLVARCDGKPVPKVIDFGVAKAVEQRLTEKTLATQFGAVVGTPQYMSPEQAGLNELDIDTRSDIYSLGVLLYELLTGTTPLTEAAVQTPPFDEVLRRIRTEEPPRPSTRLGESGERLAGLSTKRGPAPATLAKQLRGDLDWIVMTALEKDRDRRYQTAGGLALDIEKHLNHETVSARPPTVRYRVGKLIRRHRIGVAMGATLLLAATAAAGLRFYQRQSARQTLAAVLQESKLARIDQRAAGWFTTNWMKLARAAATLGPNEVAGQATAVLAGLDARLAWEHWDVGGASAAFADDGRVLIGGTTAGRGTPALLFDTNGVKSELPVRGDGRVCWDVNDVPLHFTASNRGGVLREANTGKVRREFPFHEGEAPVESDWPVVAVSADGTLVAAAATGSNGAARVVVWDAVSGQALGEAPSRATALAFSPDGSLVGVGGVGGQIEVFALPKFSLVATLPPAARPTPILGLAFGRDVLTRDAPSDSAPHWVLGAGDQGGMVVVWDLGTHVPRSFCRGSVWNVQSVAFHPDGLTMVSAGRSEALLWDVMTGQLLLRFQKGSGSDTRALAFNRDGTELLVGNEARSSRSWLGLWKMEPHHGIHALRGFVTSARKVWFSPNSQLVAALSDDWRLAVWEAESGKLLRLFDAPIGDVADNADGVFDAPGRRFAFATWTNACLYDLDTGRVLQRWRLTNGFSDQLQFDHEGRLLLVRREPRADRASRRFWHLYELSDGDTPRLRHEQSDLNWRTGDTFFRPGGDRFLVSGTNLNSAKLEVKAYDAVSGRELWHSTTDCQGMLKVYLDPTGQWFSYMPVGSQLRLMRWSDFGEVRTTGRGYEAISPSGQEFAGNAWLVWDPRGPAHSIPFDADSHHSSVPPAFSPDGQYLARATIEGVIQLVHRDEAWRRLALLGASAR